MRAPRAGSASRTMPNMQYQTTSHHQRPQVQVLVDTGANVVALNSATPGAGPGLQAGVPDG